MARVQTFLGICCAAFLFCSANAQAPEVKPGGATVPERRVALVIGNSGYKFSPLLNPGNDARAMAAALRDTGFTVIEKRNLGQAAIRQAIREFGDELAKGGVGLFYYAGHGIQLRGRNYLLPVGADIQREDEIEDQSVDVNLVLQKFGAAKNALNILIMDACRNNPFAGTFGSQTTGLAAMDAPPGTLIAFSTAPGYVAADGSGDNSIYTQNLVATLREPGLKLEDVFKKVRAAVRQDSGGKQVPWENTSLEKDFYFTPPDLSKLAAQQQERDKAVQDAIERAVLAALSKREKELAAAQAAKIEQESRAARASIERLTKELVELRTAPKVEAERTAIPQLQVALTTAQSTPRSVAEPAASVPQQAALAVPPDKKENEPVTPRQQQTAPQTPAQPVASVIAREPVISRPQIALAVPSPRPQPVVNIGGRVERPDIRVGDQWKYQITDGYTGEKRMVAVGVVKVTENYIYTQSAPTSLAAVDPSLAGGLLDVWDRNWNLLRQGNAEYAPFYPSMQFPLESGKNWSGTVSIDVGGSDRLIHELAARAVGWERVTVPAGIFDAVRITLRGDYRLNSATIRGGGGAINDAVWYAPTIRQIVKKEIQQRPFGVTGGNYSGGVRYQQFERWELVEYKLN